jgi:hypothetical protein
LAFLDLNQIDARQATGLGRMPTKARRIAANIAQLPEFGAEATTASTVNLVA